MPTKYPCLLGYDGTALRAAWTASSEQVAHPDDHLNSASLGEAWRSAIGALSAVTLTWDLGAAYTVFGVAFAGLNWTLLAERRIILSADPSLAPTLADSGQGLAFDTSLAVLAGGSSGPWMPPWGRTMVWFPTSPVTARYGRLTIWDPTNGDNYLRAAVPLLGPGWQPGIGIEPGSWTQDLQWVGEPGNRVPRRGHRLALHRLVAAERSQILSLAAGIADQGRFVVVPRPLAPETYLAEAYLGHLEGDGIEMSHIDQLARWSRTELAFREADT